MFRFIGYQGGQSTCRSSAGNWPVDGGSTRHQGRWKSGAVRGHPGRSGRQPYGAGEPRSHRRIRRYSPRGRCRRLGARHPADLRRDWPALPASSTRSVGGHPLSHKRQWANDRPQCAGVTDRSVRVCARLVLTNGTAANDSPFGAARSSGEYPHRSNFRIGPRALAGYSRDWVSSRQRVPAVHCAPSCGDVPVLRR